MSLAVKETLEAEIKNIQEKLAKLSQASKDNPEERRKVVKEVVGDAEAYLVDQIAFLRRILAMIEV